MPISRTLALEARDPSARPVSSGPTRRLRASMAADALAGRVQAQAAAFVEATRVPDSSANSVASSS